jgi:hypothetical protein
MFFYAAYGLSIASALPFNNLPPLASKKRGTNADLTIRFGDTGTPPRESETIAAGKTFKTSEEGVFFFFEQDNATVLVRNGLEIIINPSGILNDRGIRATILGPAMGVLLHQRGRLVLHASAVVIGGCAVAFAGSHGRGKSSLALALYRMGHQLIADDITSIEYLGDVPIVFPAYPQINVWPETLTALSCDPMRVQKIEPGYEKRSFPIPRGFSADPANLTHIYILDEGETTGVQSLPPRVALAELVRHSYHFKYYGESADTSHFFQCAALVNSVGIHRITAHRSIGGIIEAAAKVKADISIRQQT